VEVGGLPEKKKTRPSPDKIPAMGRGRRKCAERTGLHPASAVRGLHKAAPPPLPPFPCLPPRGPRPCPPRPPAPYGRPGAGAGPAGVGRAGEVVAAQAAGRLLPGPARPGEGERLGAQRTARPPGGWGRGRGLGGAFLETLAKYSLRTGTFLEMPRRR
jgi:hypothetical protein